MATSPHRPMVHSALHKGGSRPKSGLQHAESDDEGSQSSGQPRQRISFAVLQPLTIGASADLDDDEASDDGAVSDGPHSLSHGTTPKTPFTAHKKWDAVMQRLHQNQQQIVRRRPGSHSVGFASGDSPGDSPDANEERGFHKWKTLRKRLKEVKQDLDPDRSASDDGSSTLGGESMSMVEAQLVELLSEPAEDAAGEGRSGKEEGSSGSRYGSRGGLNLTVYRFRGSTLPLAEQQALSELQQLQQQQQAAVAAAQASPFAAASHAEQRASAEADGRDGRHCRESRDDREARGSSDSYTTSSTAAGARRASLQRSINLESAPSSSFVPASAPTSSFAPAPSGASSSYATAYNAPFAREDSACLAGSVRSSIARATMAGLQRIDALSHGNSSVLEQQTPQLQPSQQQQRSFRHAAPAAEPAAALPPVSADDDRVQRGGLRASTSSHALQDHMASAHVRMPSSSSGNSSIGSGDARSPNGGQQQGSGFNEVAGAGYRGGLLLSPDLLLPASRFPQHGSMQDITMGDSASTAAAVSGSGQHSTSAALGAAASGAGSTAMQRDAWTESTTSAAVPRSASVTTLKRPSLFIPVANGDVPRDAPLPQASASSVAGHALRLATGAAGAAGMAGAAAGAAGAAGTPRSAMLQSLRLRVAVPSGGEPSSPALADSLQQQHTPLHHAPFAAGTATPSRYGSASLDAAARADALRAPYSPLPSTSGRVLASFKVPAAMYTNQEDILNDADIQDLLQLVAKSCGAPAGAPSHVHWHMPHTPMRSEAADTYRTSTIYSPGLSTTGAAPASGCGTELHVHVDQQQDGRLSVIISGTEDGADQMDGASHLEGSGRAIASQPAGPAAGAPHGQLRAAALAVGRTDDGSSTSGSRNGRGSDSYHSPRASSSPRWQLQPSTRPISDDGCSEVVSDLSAMGNPMAYSARLCSRLEQHAVPHGSQPASPSGAAQQLERYLDTNQALKQKAGKLQATFAKRQQEDNHQQHGPPASRLPSRSFSKHVAASVHTALSPKAQSGLNRPSLTERFGSSKGLARLGAAGAGGTGLLGSLRSSAPEFSTPVDDGDDDKLNVEQLKREMERHLMRTS